MTKEELEKEVEECMHNALFWLKLPISKENVEKGSSYIFELLEPREKRIAELEEKISILLSCNSCPDNKGGLLCQKEYEDKCLAQKIQYIKELQQENAELRTKTTALENANRAMVKELDDMTSGGVSVLENVVRSKEQLAKAKEIIKKFSEFANLEVEYDPEHPQEHTDLWNELCKETEQFLKECE